jgi:hypothetical protein
MPKRAPPHRGETGQLDAGTPPDQSAAAPISTDDHDPQPCPLCHDPLLVGLEKKQPEMIDAKTCRDRIGEPTRQRSPWIISSRLKPLSQGRRYRVEEKSNAQRVASPARHAKPASPEEIWPTGSCAERKSPWTDSRSCEAASACRRSGNLADGRCSSVLELSLGSGWFPDRRS